MAEGVVGMLILKLGSALAIEAIKVGTGKLCRQAKASSIARLFGQIRDIKEELESMQSFLQEAERFKDTDNTTASFINKIRGLAFEIEDVVDEFTYKLEDKHGGFSVKIKRQFKRISTWRRLSLKLRDIKLKLENVDRRKARYDMRGIAIEARNSDAHCRSTDQTSYFPIEENLVGIDESKNLLINWLTSDFQQENVISTVWGMGGVGKTTLVAHVYNTLKIDFDCAAWVTVSKAYQVQDLLKQIIRELQKSDLKGELRVDIVDMEKRSLVEIIRDFLRGKKYLLVLDDVWGIDIWFKIRDAFPTNSTSRFVITSRIHDVALLATGNCMVELKPLEAHHSWELFCKEAFWKNENRICPEELQFLAQRFVDKCNGLPIAIACIGRLLSCKSQTHSEWEKLYKELEVQLTNNAILDVNIVLMVSLGDLPYILKNCFLHCIVFPEDYLIKRKRLIRHWVTAGFIRETEHKTMEEVAEGYLYELVNRSLLQVVERNESGRVRSCRMHDIIRLLALAKSNEERFCRVHDGSVSSSAENTRRLSIQSPNIEQLTLSSEVQLRSIYVFDNGLTIDSLKPFLKSFKLLSTLDLQGSKIRRLPNEIFNMFNLRFLGLRDTEVEDIPKTVGRLQKLEVLDAYNAKLLSLPESVVTLRKLRYLYVATDPKTNIKGVVAWTGIQVPNGIRHLTDLQALQLVEASSETLCHLGALTELRTLSITKVQREQCVDLCNAIMNMTHLVSLAIMAINEKETLELEELCLPPTLSKLEIGGQLDRKRMPQIVSSFSDHENITLLALAFSKLDEDSFSCLLVLHGLRALWLDKAYEGKRLHFNAMTFPKLRLLSISDAPQLNDVVVEESALQSLVHLSLTDCPELKALPDGIEHLRTLEKLYLRGVSKDLTKKLQNKEKTNECNDYLKKINHVRRVTVYP
ncbi:disease resistance protein RPM1-like [Triticum dicoccoides]|uniref:Disease resistance protein RPM1 n=1 Tax=Triticum turgidum subsp. durum TaxID=4567 RepID=A0A9R1NPK0_TRITD|nr:disease resistance protein RPM1-like [Triticum dicoccoides]XP_044456163.1 disease resistance protein RPM1-like [Triticum aestivum]VAH28711.1 unnamed protein product [Triticum turgidum subsp. durum]